MNAKETLQLISKQWCDLDDLMQLAEIGKNNAIKLRREIKNDLIEKGYRLPSNRLPMIEKMVYIVYWVRLKLVNQQWLFK